MTVDVAATHEFNYAGATVKIFHANKGEGISKHKHDYSHATFCCAGSVIVKKENKEFIIDKNTQPINLVANEWHELEAAEDGTVFVNVFSEGKY